jgi:hypothetical protein
MLPQTPRKKDNAPQRGGDTSSASSMLPIDTGSPSRVKQQSYSPREEAKHKEVPPTQSDRETPPPIPHRSPTRLRSSAPSSPDVVPVPLRHSERLRKVPTRLGNVYGEDRHPIDIECKIRWVRDWEQELKEEEETVVPPEFEEGSSTHPQPEGFDSKASSEEEDKSIHP